MICKIMKIPNFIQMRGGMHKNYLRTNEVKKPHCRRISRDKIAFIKKQKERERDRQKHSRDRNRNSSIKITERFLIYFYTLLYL